MGLSNEAFDGVASLLEKTVTEESQIATAVSGDNVCALLKSIQSQVDSWRNKFYDKDKELNAYREKHPENAEPPKDPPKEEKDEEPEWARKLREQNELIAARFEAEEKAKARVVAISAVEAGLKESGCTNPGILKSTLKGFSLKEEEKVEDAIERLKGEYNETYKETFGDGPIPGMGGQAFGDAKNAVSHKNDFLRSQGLLPKQDK